MLKDCEKRIKMLRRRHYCTVAKEWLPQHCNQVKGQGRCEANLEKTLSKKILNQIQHDDSSICEKSLTITRKGSSQKSKPSMQHFNNARGLKSSNERKIQIYTLIQLSATYILITHKQNKKARSDQKTNS